MPHIYVCIKSTKLQPELVTEKHCKQHWGKIKQLS